MNNNNTENRHTKASANLKQIWLQYKNLTGKDQLTIATELGITQGNFSQYVTGKNKISLPMLFAFMEYFNCKASDIFEELS